jgi:hypothetical protein
VTYDSAREADFARQLDLLKHGQGKDRVDSWERQLRIPLIVNNQKICDFVPDFLVRYADGRRELVEVKGMQTDVFKLKLNLFCATWLADHPEVEYRIVN